MADDPSNPDWRVLSARGTALAKQSKYSEAIPFYERALQLSPGQRSVMNNLALAYTMSGEAHKAETVLRQADPTGADPRIKQNLALVMSLQGRHDEAKQLAGEVPVQGVRTADDVDTLRKIVRAQPAPASKAAAPATAVAGWRTVVVEKN
jgi:Flp pilus assembly protein TadD